jgi:hypothetical protein
MKTRKAGKASGPAFDGGHEDLSYKVGSEPNIMRTGDAFGDIFQVRVLSQ